MIRARILPCVCRPSGWIALWRRIGQCAILDQRVTFP
ncbi:hypothetical protein BDD41_1677 [Paracoccus versutus]|uniref:Uncharacterized protein n=1 Tax=Paracoccus versutus TaxID=34007 RepID=A0A3D9Y1U5_PARVE|nr:hypothetical protein BDD41_1677 [Paracoccus versutus]